MTRQFSLRRVLVLLLLPGSLLPVFMLSPSLVRAPATLWLRAERFLVTAHHRARPAPPPAPRRYPIGASRLEVDIQEPAAGPLTSQIGVSPLAEHNRWAPGAHQPIVLIVHARELAR